MFTLFKRTNKYTSKKAKHFYVIFQNSIFSEICSIYILFYPEAEPGQDWTGSTTLTLTRVTDSVLGQFSRPE